jgi:uncharacterized protein
MDSSEANPRGGLAVMGICVAIGLMVGGWILGHEIKQTKLGDRYVSVKGLSERTVKSDLAIWTLGYKEAGDELGALYSKSESDKKTILEFLAKQGIQASEIEIGVIDVTDTQTNEWSGARQAPKRFIAQQQITVWTPRVDVVAAASQKTIQLLQAGIVLSSGANGGLVYKFTGLNSIKPDMITDATRGARASADRFASDSGSRVGTIRQASQGIFSILSANAGDANEDDSSGGSSSSDTSIMKTVRVVSSVDYYLVN